MTLPALPDTRRFLFLLSSARRGGNSELLAQRAAEALPPTVAREWLDLSTLALPPFEDLRHTGQGYPTPTGVLESVYQATVAATDLVFVAPTYWYSLPAPAKLYLDHWSGFLRAPGRDFRGAMAGRALWLVTVHSGGPEDAWASEAVETTLRHTAAYMGMRWQGALVGHGSRPGDVLQDEAALTAATRFLTGPGRRAA